MRRGRKEEEEEEDMYHLFYEFNFAVTFSFKSSMTKDGYPLHFSECTLVLHSLHS